MEIIGKTTINPYLFYSGKIAGYLTWIVLFLLIFNIDIVNKGSFYYNNYISLIILVIGLAFTIISIVNLGNSTRLGLPTDDTIFKTNGLYRISRNPMYLGFNLLTISSMIYTLNIFIIIPGIYSIIIYHRIILAEEGFLESRFNDEYLNYKQKTRRYL